MDNHDNRSVTVELLMNVVTRKRVRQSITVNTEIFSDDLFYEFCELFGNRKTNEFLSRV